MFKIVLLACSHCTYWIYDLQSHLAYIPGGLAKASIVHIAPSESMTSIVHSTQVHAWPSSPLNSHHKEDIVSNPA